VRVLLDENIPVDLAPEIIGHRVDTVVALGWAGVANGELLRRASGHYDALITMDRNIEFQQDISPLPLGVLVLRAVSNRRIHLRPLVPALLDALAMLAPGEIRQVGASSQ